MIKHDIFKQWETKVKILTNPIQNQNQALAPL